MRAAFSIGRPNAYPRPAIELAHSIGGDLRQMKKNILDVTLAIVVIVAVVVIVALARVLTREQVQNVMSLLWSLPLIVSAIRAALTDHQVPLESRLSELKKEEPPIDEAA